MANVHWRSNHIGSTKFFDCMANADWRSKHIGSLVIEGVETKEEESIHMGVVSYYENLFRETCQR